jgi:hypothetical protein
VKLTEDLQYTLKQNIFYCICNSEVNLTGEGSVNVVKVQGYFGYTPPFVLNPSHFTPRDTALIPIEQKAGWTQSWSGCFGEDRRSCLCQELNPGSSVIQPLA